MAETLKTQNNGALMNGADILVECLIRNGVDTIFAYPGGASMPLHQSLTKVEDRLRTVLPRHEQGGGFMAQLAARPGRLASAWRPAALSATEIS